MIIESPRSEQQLLQRAQNLAGQTLAQLAAAARCDLPENLLRAKGWVGQLLECHLGAMAKSKPIPDFPHLGIELKTIPVNRQGAPLESTYVCTVQLQALSRLTWDTSYVRQKLARVLWIPVQADKSLALAQRRIGMPLLWSPDDAQTQLLKSDWQELTDMICLGQLSQITARLGQVLQIRPKAANAKALCSAIGEQGEPILTLPRGFYLRPRFTQSLLQSYYAPITDML